MRNAPRSIVLFFPLLFLWPLLAGGVFAQTLPAPAPPQPSLSQPVPGKPGSNQLIERITVDDGGSKIQEIRFGGETRSITVQPKNGMPAYDVRPISGADQQPGSGARTWKIFGF